VVNWYPCCCPAGCCVGHSTANEYEVTIEGMENDPYSDCYNCWSINGTYTLASTTSPNLYGVLPAFIDCGDPAGLSPLCDERGDDCWFFYSPSSLIWTCQQGDVGQPKLWSILLRVSNKDDDGDGDPVCRYDVWFMHNFNLDGDVSGDDYELAVRFRHEVARPATNRCTCALDGTYPFEFLNAVSMMTGDVYTGDTWCEYESEATVTVEGPV